MATVQETIDNLISYIDAAVAKHSVSNRHVATVLEFLNSELKIVREELVQMEELYLSKTKDDVAHGLITFVKGLLSFHKAVSMLDSLTIGDFLDTGDSIQGAQITKEGFGSFAGLKSPYMEIFELILNKQTATGGEFRISDVGTIEDVTYLFEGRESISFADYDEAVHGRPYGALLVLREEYEGYITTFKYDDIVYGYVNRIGESGAYARYGQFYGVVKEVMGDRMLRVLIYSDSQVPTTVNLLPVPYMVITQRGNETDTTRQSVITLSSPDKNIVILHGVDSPILAADGSCYGVSLGRLPDVLYDYVVKAYPYLAREDMSLYVKNLIVQNLMRIDHLGKAIKDERYRGAWSQAVANGTVDGEDKYRVMPTTYDTVTHLGSKWQCQKDGSTVEPSDTTTEWSIIVAKGDTGGKGDTGDKGDKGDTGTGIKSVTVEYAVTDTYARPTDESKWNGPDMPSAKDGQYLWTRTITDYTDGDVDDTITFSVTKIGANGTSITVSATEYQVGSSSSEQPTGTWSTEMPGVDDGLYLWTRITFSDGSKAYTVGKSGENGKSVSINFIRYGLSDSPSTKPSDSDADPNNNWKDSYDAVLVDGVIPEGKFLWTWTQYSDPSAPDGVMDAYGVSRQGHDGKSIKAVSTEYFITPTFKEPDNTADWPDTMDAAITEAGIKDGKIPAGYYLWTRTIIDYTDGSLQDKVGVTVTKMGENGTGVSANAPKYMLSANGAAHPSVDNKSWSEAIPSAEEGKYLWTWIRFTDGTDAFSVSKSGESATIDSISYSTVFTKEQPDDGTFTEENPPVVPEGGYLWSRTVFKTAGGNKSVYSYAYQGLDNSAVVYALKPNVNVVYIRDRKEVSTDCIDLTVIRTSSAGTEEITDSAVLGTYGLQLEYTIDGETADREVLNIGETLLELEDGSGVLADESGAAMQLEFTVENILKVKKNITFFLVDTEAGKDVAVCVVPVMYDGSNTVSLFIDKPVVSHTVDAETLHTIGSKDYVLQVRLMSGTDVLPLDSDYKVTLEYTDNAGGIQEIGTVIDTGTNTATAGFRILSGADSSKMPENIRVTLGVPGVAAAPSAVGNICVVYQQRGIVGRMGPAGPFYYPMGAWNLATALLDPPVYVVKENRGPYVLYPKDKTGIRYLRTEYDMHYTTNGLPLNPAEDYAKYGAAAAWKPMEKFEALEAAVAIIDFGTVGRAVFWGNYQFSVDGYDTELKAKSSYREDMFRSDGRLNGKFIPNYFVDFVSGEVKLGKLSEPFVQWANDGDNHCKKIDFDEGYNVSVQPTDDKGMVCMPNPTAITAKDGTVLESIPWMVDGAHSLIIHQADDGYQNMKGSDYLDGSTIGGYLVVLCADGRLVDNRSYRMAAIHSEQVLVYAPLGYSGTDDDHEGYFCINGCYTKFLLLAPGELAKLRYCETVVGATTKRYWYVENQSDFKRVKVLLQVAPGSYYDETNKKQVSNGSYVPFDHTSDSGYYYGTHAAWASEYVKEILGGVALEYVVTLDDDNVVSSMSVRIWQSW